MKKLIPLWQYHKHMCLWSKPPSTFAALMSLSLSTSLTLYECAVFWRIYQTTPHKPAGPLPQSLKHTQRTKTVNHVHNLFPLIWFAFEIDFGFNFDQEQMGLLPALTVSLLLRFSGTFLLLITPTHTQSTFTHHRRTHSHNKAEGPQTLGHFQRGLTKLFVVQSEVFKDINYAN